LTHIRQFLFAGRGGEGYGLTTREYARFVGQWIASIGLDPLKFGTHSLRRRRAKAARQLSSKAAICGLFRTMVQVMCFVVSLLRRNGRER
jgi:hypothetical protein